MVQLIVVTISIILTSAMAVIGFQYVGGAFMDGKDRATALQYVAQGAQIAAAWKNWSKATGNKYPTQIDWYATESSNLVPDYLNALPRNIHGLTGRTTWLPMKKSYFATTGTMPNIVSSDANVDSVMFWLATNKQSARICTQIAALSQGKGASPFAIASNNGTPRNNTYFDCFYVDANANGVMDSTENGIIVYRVF